MPDCDHTLHIEDELGRPQGSWVEEKTRDGVRVVCGSCGKFYGYLRNGVKNDRRRKTEVCDEKIAELKSQKETHSNGEAARGDDCPTPRARGVNPTEQL